MNNPINPPRDSQLTRLQSENAYASSFANVRSPVEASTARRQFGIKTIVINPGESYQLSQAGTFIYLDSAEFTSGGYAVGNLVRAQDSNDNEVLLDRPQAGYYFERAFDWVTVTNESLEIVRLSLYIGFGRVQKDAQDSFGYVPLGVAAGGLVRPANVTAYAAGEIVNDVSGISTPIFTQPLAFEKLVLNSLTIFKNSANVALTSFLVEIYSQDPGLLADQAPAPIEYVNASFLMGTIEVDTFVTGAAGSDASYFSITGIAIPVFTSGYQFFFVRLVANGAYVPISGENFSFRFGYEQGS